MIERFLDSSWSYKVNTGDMPDFLNACEQAGLRWSHGLKPTKFNPFKFYEGDNIRFIEPIQKIDDRNEVYIKCFDERLYFSFHLDWFITPYMRWKNE